MNIEFVRGVVRSLFCVVVALAGCVGPPGPDPASEGASDDDAEATAEQALTSTCSGQQNHGGSFTEQTFSSTIGCAIPAGQLRSAFWSSHSGAGSCAAIEWADPNNQHDGTVKVTITNSALFLTGTCVVTVQSTLGCPHTRCEIGAPLDQVCDSCTAQICAADPFCCNNQWDATCRNEVQTVCNSLKCGTVPPCPHAECSAGAPMPTTCSPSVSRICGQDPYCCTTAWDSICVAEVASVAGKNCN